MKQLRDGIMDEFTYNNAHLLFEMNGDLWVGLGEGELDVSDTLTEKGNLDPVVH